MWVESLESRRLLSAAMYPVAANYSPAPAALRAAFHVKAPTTLTRNIIGSYSGEISVPVTTPESTRTPGPAGSR